MKASSPTCKKIKKYFEGEINLPGFKKRSHLVDLLTPVHPRLSSLVAANPPPLKLAAVSRISWKSRLCMKRPPAPAAMGRPVQSLAVQGAVPDNISLAKAPDFSVFNCLSKKLHLDTWQWRSRHTWSQPAVARSSSQSRTLQFVWQARL